MTKHGFLPSFPLLVLRDGTTKLKIIQGHHRFMEAKQQELRVYYVVVDPEAELDIFDFEGSSHQAWSLTDHVKARALAGSQPYIELLAFQEAHLLPLGIAAKLLGGSRAKAQFIKRGKFIITGDKIHALKVVGVTDACRAAGVDFANSSGFVEAVATALYVEAFDRDTFIGKVRRHPKFMSRRSSRNEYLEEIEAMYNRSSRKLLAVRVEALKKSRERAPASLSAHYDKATRSRKASIAANAPPVINR